MIHQRRTFPPLSNPNQRGASFNPIQQYIVDRITIDCNGCWLWDGALQTQGYGTGWWDGKTVRAHRLSFEAFNGPVPTGALALHTCHVRRCCNPAHLYAGTSKQNADDMWGSGRGILGSDHAYSKITEACALSIYHDDRPSRRVAIDYGISKTVVLNIRKGRTWGHVTGATRR